jgi:hypothetical protein
MDKLVIDPALRAQFPNLAGPVEFCDEAGKTLGHFLPADVYREFLLAWVNANITEEELERRRQEPGGRTLAEIWKSLGQA